MLSSLKGELSSIGNRDEKSSDTDSEIVTEKEVVINHSKILASPMILKLV